MSENGLNFVKNMVYCVCDKGGNGHAGKRGKRMVRGLEGKGRAL